VSSFIAVKIRVRSNDDLDALVAVAARVRHVDNYPSELPGGDFVRFFTRPEPIAAWVAISDDAVIGHVAVSPRTSRAARARGRSGSASSTWARLSSSRSRRWRPTLYTYLAEQLDSWPFGFDSWRLPPHR
jgi:hypothetical protein